MSATAITPAAARLADVAAPNQAPRIPAPRGLETILNILAKSIQALIDLVPGRAALELARNDAAVQLDVQVVAMIHGT
jgi:hypothetical protein